MSEQEHLTKITKAIQNRAKQQHTYHRWFIDMECRNDILRENQFINTRIRNKATPLLSRFKKVLIKNKWRIYYFVGFCVFFSLDPVYDFLVIDNPYIKYTEPSFLLNSLLPKQAIEEQRRTNQKQLRKLLRRNSNASQIANIFLQYDKLSNLTSADLKDFQQFSSDQQQTQKKGEEYVDIVRFVREFGETDPQELRSKLRYKFGEIF